MRSLSLAASLFACLIVGHAIPTPEKIVELPEEKKTNEPINLDEKSPTIVPTTENDSDDLLRQKKSSTTTFCVEIKPGAAEPCVTICDPKPELFVPEYILPPLHVKPPPPTYLIKEPSCPCGLTPPALITIPHGVSLSSLHLKPIIGRSAESDLAMDYMPMDSSNLMDHVGDTRTFPESLTASSQLNMFGEPSRSGMNRGPAYPQGSMNGASSTVNLNRGQTHLTTCTSNVVPLLQRDYPMSAGNPQAFQSSMGDRRLYQYKAMDGLQGLTMDPSSGMMQSNNMQYQQSWPGPQRYSAGSEPLQQMISNEYARNSLGQLAANQNQAYQLTQQRQMMTPSMYSASRQMPSTINSGNGYQAMYANDQPAVAQQMQRAVYSGGQAASAQQMQRAVYSGDQAASAQQMQQAVYRGDQAAAARQMTPAMYSGSQQPTAQQSSNQQQAVDRGQTNQQMAAGSDVNAMMGQRGNQQKSGSQQGDVGASGYQENAESSSKQQVYQTYAGDGQSDRSPGTDQKLSSQSEGMSRSERMMRRMKATVAGQSGSDQPFMATAATQVPQEKHNADCGQQPIQETMKA